MQCACTRSSTLWMGRTHATHNNQRGLPHHLNAYVIANDRACVFVCLRGAFYYHIREQLSSITHEQQTPPNADACVCVCVIATRVVRCTHTLTAASPSCTCRIKNTRTVRAQVSANAKCKLCACELTWILYCAATKFTCMRICSIYPMWPLLVRRDCGVE